MQTKPRPSETSRSLASLLACLGLALLIAGLPTIATSCKAEQKGAPMTQKTAELLVMSFNVLDEGGGTTGWASPTGRGRHQKAIKTIQAVAPDIMGVQEDRQVQAEDIQKGLGESYAYFGVGGEDGEAKGRFNSIFYRNDRFARTDQGTIWLSDNPDTAGSAFAGMGPRTATWVKLRDTKTNQSYFVLNAHWENGSHGARINSAKLLRRRIPILAGGLPVIVTGDLNCKEDSSEFQDLLGRNDPEGFQLRDAYRQLFPEARPDQEGTCENNPKAPRIDFILHTDFFKPAEVVIHRERVDGGWGSDHFPVAATLLVAVAGD